MEVSTTYNCSRSKEAEEADRAKDDKYVLGDRV